MSSMQFSADYIRSQPEYQYLVSRSKEDGKPSINLNDYSLRIIKDKKSEEETESSKSSSSRSAFVLQTMPSPFRLVSSPLATSPRSSRGSTSSTLSVFSCSTGNRRTESTRPVSVSSILQPIDVRGHGLEKKVINENNKHRINSTNYDPTLEKTQQFLHGYGTAFTQASQALIPFKRGLRRVEVHYSETNVEQNGSIIFADLIKNAHKSNIICKENVENLERRLLTKRKDLHKATTFYDPFPLPPSSIAAPRSARIAARTVTGKKEERKKRIKKKDDKIKLGYEPRVWSLKSPTYGEIQKILSCRYLRIDPKHQPDLYGITDSETTKRPKTAT